jgi:hypothetical protein
MPAVSLNQRSGALTALGFAKESFSGWFFFRCSLGSAVQSFGPLQRLLSEREL